MDLGHVNVRGQNVDLLHQAIHPDYGVVWTDGKTIYLAPVQLSHGQVVNQRALKLGKFEHSVRSIHWSCNIGPHTCYMCVVHTQHLSLWKVDGVIPKLNFKQVRKLNVQPISKGCLWNPCRDILCILSKQQCSFFFNHAQDRGSFALPPLESGTISCGAWSHDGQRLVLCVGAVILMYTWDDIDRSISSFTPSAWKIPGLDCSIRSVVLLSRSLLVCATELPLESLCKNQDMFDAPTVFNGDHHPHSNGSDIIVPKKQNSSQSITGTLFNLPRNPQSVMQETAQLVTIQLRENRDPHRKSCARLHGLLSPEILIFEPSLRSLVVGSNTQNVLQVFTFTKEGPGGDLIKSAEIHMDKLERPKGIGLIPKGVAIGYKGVLIAAGAKKSNDSTFLPSPSGSNMDVKLKFYPIDVDLHQMQSDKEMNESADSSESVHSSQSSIESPRQQTEVNTEQEQTENMCLKDQNENSVPDQVSKEGIPGADLYLPKQKTRSELCDPSDTDSEVSPREVTHYSEQTDSQDSAVFKQSDVEDLPVGDSEKPEYPVPKMVLTDVVLADNDSESPREITLLPSSDNTSSRPKIVNLRKSISVESDLETEKVDFSEQEPVFRNSLSTADIEEEVDEITESLKSKLPLDTTESSNTERGDNPDVDVEVDAPTEGYQQQLSDKGWMDKSENEESMDEALKIELMEQEILEQNEQIKQLNAKVSKLSQMIEETSLVFPSKYQTVEKPETLLVVCRCSNKKTVRKTFLLDNGRLPLDAVKASFNLETVEIFLDGDPCTVASNIDGYIPLRFEPFSTIIIQGKQSNPIVPSHHHDSDSDQQDFKLHDSSNKSDC